MELTYVFDCRDKDIENQCVKIFDGNNQGYIFNRDDITNHDNMLLAVALCDGEAVGYQLIYFGGDFVELDGAVKRKGDITYYPDDSVYIWDCCTAKEHECKGVQTFLIKKLLEHFRGRCIYTITALDNIRSVEIQEKLGFKRIGAFDSKCGPCGIYMKS